ncbi:SRPBCC family protein [Flavobacterium pallidum]|nr:SRPBCC domain-containing protein [Flavobacterium pallidum]
MDNDKLVIEHIYDASGEKTWNALTDIAQMKQWYFPQLADFKPKAGFQTEFNVHHEGKDFVHIWKVTEVIPLQKIAYEWRYAGYPGNSLLQFEISPKGEKTKLTLTHSGLASFKPEEFPALSKDNFMLGWTHFTTALGDFIQ